MAESSRTGGRSLFQGAAKSLRSLISRGDKPIEQEKAKGLPRGEPELVSDVLAGADRIKNGDVGDHGQVFVEVKAALVGLIGHFYEREDAVVPPAQLMQDPIILASGRTVSREFYRSWFANPHNRGRCPVTQQTLSHLLTPPNDLIRDMLSEWCRDYSAPLAPVPDEAPPETAMAGLIALLSVHTMKRDAMHKIQLLSKSSGGTIPSLTEHPELVHKLFNLITDTKADAADREEAMTTLFYLSVHPPNQVTVGAHPCLIAWILRFVPRMPRMLCAKAIALLAILMEVDENRGQVHALKGMNEMSELLLHDDLIVRKEAGMAVLRLCKGKDQKAIDARADVLLIALESLRTGPISDECLLIMRKLARAPGGLAQLMNWDAAHLMNVVTAWHRDRSVSSRSAETAVDLLYRVGIRNVRELKKVKQFDGYRESLKGVALRGGTPLMRRRAAEILGLIEE